MTTITAHEYEYYTGDGDYDLRALLLHLYDAHAYDATTYSHPSNLGERESVENYHYGDYREAYEARLTLNAVHETLHQYKIGEAV
jgi:hypothetical protein